MSIFIDNAISGWIRNAEETGELKNNEFNGKKIDLDDYLNTPESHRVGMKILKDANCLPPAVELMKQIDLKKQQLANIKDAKQHELLQKEIKTLELKRNLTLEVMQK